MDYMLNEEVTDQMTSKCTTQYNLAMDESDQYIEFLKNHIKEG